MWWRYEKNCQYALSKKKKKLNPANFNKILTYEYKLLICDFFIFYNLF